ncbi:hypothetical protein N8996_06205, partial [Candidatus Poseidonia alphae]|nr:hypothetical protein [Candidatus Poseidonia alphae]
MFFSVKRESKTFLKNQTNFRNQLTSDHTMGVELCSSEKVSTRLYKRTRGLLAQLKSQAILVQAG